MEIMKYENLKVNEAPSPAPSLLSVKSNQSMDRPIVFNIGAQSTIGNKYLKPCEASSPAPSFTSLKSEQSMDRPIVFREEAQNYSLKSCEAASPAPSFTSLKSEQSMDRPIVFGEEAQNYRVRSQRPDEVTSPATSYFSLKSNHSVDRLIVSSDRTQHNSFKCLKSCEAATPAPSFASLKSELSMDRPIVFGEEAPNYSTFSGTLLTEDRYRCPVCTEVFKDPVSIPCGHSYCKHCIEIYWSKHTQAGGYACPQCRKRFRVLPVLKVNVALSKLIEELQKAGFSPAFPAHCYTGPEDVPCDICTEMKLKAVKSCLTCTASYCETHVRQHYTVPALQRHNLMEAINLAHKEEKELQDSTAWMARVTELEAAIKVIHKEERVLEEENRALTARVTELEAALKERDMQAKRLCKGFEIHCIDFPSDVIEMAALGRSLSLGMLYNNNSNSFCQDIFMEDKISSMKVSLPRPQTCMKILEHDTIPERLKALDISPPLSQNIISLLTKLSGAAAFLNHPVQSQHHDRVILHYRTTTRLDMISQGLLQEGSLTSDINATTATHVIIGVCYGAQAFFVFDNKTISTDRNTKMENVIKRIMTFSPIDETEKANNIFYDCSLYTDVGDSENQVSFDKAVEIYYSLPLLLGSKGERVVPLKVWLYPLKKLNKTSVCAALSGISESLMHRAESILEHLRKQIRISQDMITDCTNVKVIMGFPALKVKLIQFSEFLKEFKTNFHRGIGEIVESIHMKEKEQEKSLQYLLESYDQSPFSAEKTNQWLENKKTELKILNDLGAADITVVKSQAELQQIISHTQITRLMCLTLFSPDAEDLFLTALRQHIDSDHIIPHDLLPLQLVSINQKVLIDIQLFIADKAANEDAEQTRFIAASVPDNDFPKYSVQFYHKGRIVSRNVKLETKPDLAQIVQIKHTSVSLKLNQLHTRSTDRYIVEYRAFTDSGMNNTSWNQTVFSGTLKNASMISGLLSGHQYQLRCSIIEKGSSARDFSKIINFQTAVAATPGQPLVNKQERGTLRVTWLKAEASEDCPVLRYMVEYKEAGLEGWSSIQTQGPQCECTLTVLHSTCYRVRVSAVYEDITSKPSEETPVPVDVWTIDLSERKSSILLEVLKLQTEKKPLELIDWTDEESELRGFLQCLPYISQLRFVPQSESSQLLNKRKRFILDLCLQAVLHQKGTLEASVMILLSSMNYEKYDFLLDLCSHVKDCETQIGRSVLPALQPIYQSAPAVWRIKLSERKSSILLEVLKLQTEKKPVELIDWTDEESEVKGFLQCLPYISQLSFHGICFTYEKKRSISFLVNLIAAASVFDGENYPDLLTALCSYTSFPFDEKYFDNNHQIGQCEFLLDLCSHVKDYETQIGRSVLPALQPIYQSAPAVWRIKLSERKSSILLEVLKLQTEKKPVELIDWTDEESEVKGFLQCLPYISQLSVDRQLLLKLLYCCSSSELQQEAADGLLSALQNTLDFSCCSAEDKQKKWDLTTKDCRKISTVIQKVKSVVKLVLKNCNVSNTALKQLLPILTQVQLSCNEDLQLQLLACIKKTTTKKKRTERGFLRWPALCHTPKALRGFNPLLLFQNISEGGVSPLLQAHLSIHGGTPGPLIQNTHISELQRPIKRQPGR